MSFSDDTIFQQAMCVGKWKSWYYWIWVWFTEDQYVVRFVKKRSYRVFLSQGTYGDW
jgi:hypothetical protein